MNYYHFWMSLPEFVWVIDKDMQSFKKFYLVAMKLSQIFALHFFANDLYQIKKVQEPLIIRRQQRRFKLQTLSITYKF